MPAIQYRTSDGKRIPSVTTILSRFKDSGGLIFWANQQGLDGKTLAEARDPAATSGTLAHQMVEAQLNGREIPEFPEENADVVADARNAFQQWERWRAHNKLEFIHTEVSLVSEKHRFGGTLDAIGTLGNSMCLVDFKTSNSVYVDYLFQVSAYTYLWRENYPDAPLPGGVHLLRFSKDSPDFAHHHFGDVETEIEVFLDMRRLYDAVKKAEKRVR